MFTIHEGEIVFKEKYGYTDRNRLYVKPPEQDSLVEVDEGFVRELTTVFKKLFLPQGYPNSVSKDYITYQIWDTAQAFCSTITGILATQEVLRGVGVGDTNASPLAATITWVLKDGCGHIGRILFAYSHGTVLDAYSKKWRLYADTLNDAAMCMELALPLFKHFTTSILCISTVMKSIVGVAGGATRAAMTQHHAIRGNMADVTAKDAAQETAVNLIASITALIIIALVGSSVTVFGLMITFHIIFNYCAVRAICLRTLNEPRFLQVIEAYLKKEIISTPCEINKTEPIVFYQLGTNLLDLKLSGFKINVGVSFKEVMACNPKAFYVAKVNEIYETRPYILFPDLRKGKILVLLRDTATISDQLCAYFHAVLLAIVICAINDVPLAVCKPHKNITRPFAEVCKTIREMEWSRSETQNNCAKFQYGPSIELMKYIDTIAQKEWNRIQPALSNIGWDLSKHLLIVDEWRICSEKIVTKSISMEKGLPIDETAIPTVITFDDMEDTTMNVNALKDPYTIEPEDKLSASSQLQSPVKNLSKSKVKKA